MNLLFLFLDGVGLGSDDPDANPFARARLPHLTNLLGGMPFLFSTLDPASLALESARASLLALDACLGVPGLPQSASGQATLLTGVNLPAALGYHYGPKPNPPLAEYLKNGNIFRTVREGGYPAAFLNAYPARYFEAIASRRRIYSAIPLAATSAGLPLKDGDDLRRGTAIAADLTAQGWRTHLGLLDTPILSLPQAGQRLAKLARDCDFAFFEYWLSDYAGHRQEMQPACELLEGFDQVIGGLVDAWDEQSGLILLTSDHGNLEDLTTRRHTSNPVPALIIGAPDLRRRFVRALRASAERRSATKNGYEGRKLDLSDVTPAILEFLGI